MPNESLSGWKSTPHPEIYILAKEIRRLALEEKGPRKTYGDCARHVVRPVERTVVM
ncbi:hypothetical protein RsS93_60840 [Rhizobium dioscoreae]|uniref:Uncharacterized protein n=1 Tax=Rhizobium dioscoreae TaxID=2653122 RepID=A0ABQ0ZD67_9HYPH|nr:hypothetical protein RsS93_60840 [Rhizobium dioscoreae]